MPKPRSDETKQEFIDRFMSSDEAKSDYPDSDQRYAVAESMWDGQREKAAKALRDDQHTGTVDPVMTEVHKTCEVLKADEDQRLVYGWAWVNTKDGELLFDSEDQAIETPELQKAAHQFMSEVRKAGSVHMRDPETGEKVQSGEIVESMVFSSDLQKALGIDLGKTGWFIVSKVTDDEQWRKVKKMEHISFSIGGRAETVPYQE
jgi:hypothetical protein